MSNKRVFLIVIDSVGIGGAVDADQYFNGTTPDTGANTIGHIIENHRPFNPIQWPNLAKLGLGHALHTASGFEAAELDAEPMGFYGAAQEHSLGKDTPSGHWEIAGAPANWDWHYFPNTQPAFPTELTDQITLKTGIEFLGNKHAPGTKIIEEYGNEHIATGKPIAYTSVDSVFQIAAHEKHFGIERLYQLCRDVAEIVHPMRVGRVIARPFIGENGAFTRTSNRHDYAIAPPSPTILDRAFEAGCHTIAIGKINDIFSGRGIAEAHFGQPDDGLFDDLEHVLATAPPNSLTFANFVEFDSKYGHPRDPIGYANHLNWFDERIGRMIENLSGDDLLMITADHGNDPTWIGTDHTRERVPILGVGANRVAHPLGLVDFADIGASALEFLGVPQGPHGRSFL